MGFISFTELEQECKKQNKKIYELAQEDEARLSETNVDSIRLRTLENLVAMKDAIKNGLKSTEKSISKMCGDDCAKLLKKYKKRPALLGKTFEKIIANNFEILKDLVETNQYSATVLSRIESKIDSNVWCPVLKREISG